SPKSSSAARSSASPGGRPPWARAREGWTLPRARGPVSVVISAESLLFQSGMADAASGGRYAPRWRLVLGSRVRGDGSRRGRVRSQDRPLLHKLAILDNTHVGAGDTH